MRRIVIRTEEQIDINEVDNRSFVGIQWESGRKSMIIDTPQGYCSIANDHYPNTYNVWYENNVAEYLQRALTQGNNTNSKAYAFNNPKELFEWMSL
jgi:uncharacterized NAD(P)/FAD-binding protein YdhS